MMVIVRLPSVLRRPEMTADLHIDADLATIADLINELDRRYPGLAAELDDAIFNFAVNDAIVLHKAKQQPLRDADIVEVVPAIAGGQGQARQGRLVRQVRHEHRSDGSDWSDRCDRGVERAGARHLL